MEEYLMCKLKKCINIPKVRSPISLKFDPNDKLMYENLQPELIKLLPQAKKIYIATALIKMYGYDLIEGLIPYECSRHYLIGINLPSDTEVFLKLFQAGNHTSARIYTGQKTFHPKVYVIEKQDGNYVAFVGSANTTGGGLQHNIEMSLQIEDQVKCKGLLDWYLNLFNASHPVNEKFLDRHAGIMKIVKERQGRNQSDIASLKSFLNIPQPGTSLMAANDQFFKNEHFGAYHEQNWYDHSEEANARRKNVRKRLEDLDRLIYPEFEKYGLSELSHPRSKGKRISSYRYIDGYTKADQKSIWLHYGYPEADLAKDDKMGEHSRLQVIIHGCDLGIWLVVGKNNGSHKERLNFQNELKSNPIFQQLVYKLFEDLGGSYGINIGDQLKYISDFSSPEELAVYLQTDRVNDYFIVLRIFDPTDLLISEAFIEETVLEEFQRLYPMYLLFKSLSVEK